MQSKLARVLLFIFLTQSTHQLGELAKAPLLIQHFLRLKHLCPETVVYGFFKMHYLEKTVINAGHAQDMQLPFKTIDDHALAIQLYIRPVVICLGSDFFRLVNIQLPDGSGTIIFSYSNSVFQPPKTVT